MMDMEFKISKKEDRTQWQILRYTFLIITVVMEPWYFTWVWNSLFRNFYVMTWLVAFGINILYWLVATKGRTLRLASDNSPEEHAKEVFLVFVAATFAVSVYGVVYLLLT